MSMNVSQENIDYLAKNEPKIKIGKDIYLYRTIYLITKDEMFKDRRKKSINFYLKCQIKEKSLLYLPKPQESDIIIDEIKELIELILSLCILTNSANYKISIFTSSFAIIENNNQLLKYQGKILYAKLNELKKDNDEEKQNSFSTEFKEKLNKTNADKNNNFIKINSILKEFPSYLQKQTFMKTINIQNEKIINYNDLEYSLNQEKDMINNEDNNYNIKINNKRNDSNFDLIQKIPNLSLMKYNIIYKNNLNGHDDSSFRDKLIKSRSFNFLNTFNPNSTLWDKNFNKTKSFIKKIEPNLYFSQNKIARTNSNLTIKDINNKKYFWRTLHRNSSFQFKNNNLFEKYSCNKIMLDNNETSSTYINIYNNNDSNKDLKRRNKFLYNTKYFTPFRLSYFSKKDSKYNGNSIGFKKINNLFPKKNNLLLDNEKQNKQHLENQQNLKLIQNFLFRPSIITLTKNNFYNPKKNYFNSIKNIFNEFKSELKNLSYNLNDYIENKDIKIYLSNLDSNFKQMGINLLYCFKEYCLYSYFDKFIKEKNPSILENLLYNSNAPVNQLSEFLNSLIIQINKLKNEERFNLADYVRSLKTIKNFKLSSDFFEIFVLCPNYFELTKREVTKKIALVLEIDCVTNNVTIENFINYYYIFKFGHLVKLDKKLLFINKLLHMIEGKGGPLQEKIFSDIQYLFKIDNRTKQVLLGRTYDIKMNFHITLKINQIFNSIVDYFTDENNKKDKFNLTYNNTSNISSQR